ncbi:MAG: hypothetical protein KatS3mg097_387 [Candidatus Parcubacteria bacterium]|nr:MAG: hypothetical protein KatS3mg097_387 [Candidatus Parcubacteria bacterium]
MNVDLEKVKKIFETKISNYDLNDESFAYIPNEEMKIFLQTIKNMPKTISKFNLKDLQLSHQEIEKWALIYLKIHNMLHYEKISTINDNIELIETEITATTFSETFHLIHNNDFKKLSTAYISLSLEAINNHHHSPFLISEKIILGEFVCNGGFEISLWGLKIKEHILSSVAKNILERINNNNYQKLLQKYQNFVYTI